LVESNKLYERLNEIKNRNDNQDKVRVQKMAGRGCDVLKVIQNDNLLSASPPITVPRSNLAGMTSVQSSRCTEV